jgi:hypothetical protein
MDLKSQIHKQNFDPEQEIAQERPKIKLNTP